MPRKAEIRGIERTGRKSKYGISYPRPGKTPRRVFYESKAERDRELKKAVTVASIHGTEVLAMTAADVQLVRELRTILPDGIDPREAARYYMANNCADQDCTLADGIKEYLHILQVRQLSKEYQAHVKRSLERLMSRIGPDRLLAEITTNELMAEFAALPYAARTLYNYQKYFKTFFAWTVDRGYCGRTPMAGVKAVSVPETEPKFLTVPDVQELFKTCMAHNPKVAPYLALSFFAGLRSSSIPRLAREDIKFKEKGITMPGAKHKTGRRFYVDGFEPNLWAWLEPWRHLDRLPVLGVSTISKWRQLLYLRAGVEYPKNGGRHSFCTYHVGLYGDAGKTATLLTHRGNVSVLYNHYRGNAGRDDAEDYFSIMPD